VSVVIGAAPDGGAEFADVAKAIDGGDYGAQGITRSQMEQYLPPTLAHPFKRKKRHAVVQLQGSDKPISSPAEMQWITESWNVTSVRAPYLVYMPEKDRVLMLAGCGPSLQAAILASDDRGATWGERRWLRVDKNDQPDGHVLGLTYLGQGKLTAFTENLKTFWSSVDYGQTWEKYTPPDADSEKYAWDPCLVITDVNGHCERLVGGCWTPTGVPWATPGGAYSQAYLRTSSDEGHTWSEAAKVPQWLGVNEVAITIARNNDWVAACRTDYPERFARHGFDHFGGLGVSISKDQGKTWSDLNMLYEWGRHHPSMVLLPDGRIVMTYVVRLGYPTTADQFQFGVEAVVSSDNGQTWDLQHRHVLATWRNSLQGGFFWFSGVQSTSTALLPDRTILTAFGTGFRNTPDIQDSKACRNDIALVRWRVDN
jgi:hypothetical protein